MTNNDQSNKVIAALFVLLIVWLTWLTYEVIRPKTIECTITQQNPNVTIRECDIL